MRMFQKQLFRFFWVLLTTFASVSAFAQWPLLTMPERTETRQGNKAFEKGNYTDAEVAYKKALDKKNNMPEATFNLGDAVYQQKRYDEALKQFQLSAQTNKDTLVKAKAYHNMGNTFMEQEKWQEAVNAYKQALKFNPKDEETRYNLAYANAKLKQQQQGGGSNNNQQQKQQDKQQQQNQNQQNADKQDQNQSPSQANNQQQQKQQGQQPKLSKEEAEKLLQALQNEEQKTNQKVQQKQVKVANIKIEKDW